MMSPLLRSLVASGLVIGGLVGSALASNAQPLAGPPPPNVGTPPPTPLATPLAVPPVTSPPGAYPAPCHRTNAGNSRMFPETGQAVGGEFINYWERNGGLAQQGFPLSPLITEVSELDGKPYQVQYFERAVFECHPENLGSEFTVLLTQLGTYQYRQKYPQGAPGQRPNGENPMFFAETGHTLGGEFRTYWETHGGKYQQGLPLSDEFTEVSPVDGKSYTVQYFERAVFEYHPENQPPYRVLLSLLGALRYGAKYPAAQELPPPVALPSPAPTGPLFLGYVPPGYSCGTSRWPGPLLASSSYLFWRDANSPYGTGLLGYDTQARRQLSAAQPNQALVFSSDGRTLAWVGAVRDQTSGIQRADPLIRGYNLPAGPEFTPLPIPEGLQQWAVGDNILYYMRSRVFGGVPAELYAYNFATGQTTKIASAADNARFEHLVAGAGYVAWSEQSRELYDDGLRLYLAPARNLAAVTVISTGLLGDAILTADRLLWVQADPRPDGSYNTATDMVIRMYTISTATTRVLDRGGALYLSVSENRVAWRIPAFYNQLGSTHAVVLDIATGQKRTYQLPANVGSCVKLAGSALAYIRNGVLPELYLQPLP